MARTQWIKSVSDTSQPFRYSAFDYLEGKPIDQVTFAGTEHFHVMERAYIAPYDSRSAGLMCYGGLSDHGGVLPIFAYHLRVNRRSEFVVAARRPSDNPALEAPEYLPGRWIYGGELMHHFGHFMAESSHRLYPMTSHYRELVDTNRTADGLIYSSRGSLTAFAKGLLCEYYGIPEHKIRLVNKRPVLVEQLELRPQGSIIGGSALSARYMTFLSAYQARNAKQIDKPFPKKLFIGRAHLTAGGGGIEDEHLLERHLISDGFAVVRPEEFPLTEQLEMLRQAELVVGIGGSFVHLYDHLGLTNSAMFLVSRGDPDSFYHDRTARSKVASLEYYQPNPDRGDSISTVSGETRQRYLTRYNMDYLLDAVTSYLRQQR